MQRKTKLLEMLQVQIDRLQVQLDAATDPEEISRRTKQINRLLEKKAFVESK